MPFKTHAPTIISDEPPALPCSEKYVSLDDDNYTILIVQDRLLSYNDPQGPSSFDLWRMDGNPTGTFDDFLAYEKKIHPSHIPLPLPPPGTGSGGQTGSAGGSGAAQTFIYVQNFADIEWTINHNLNRYPSITLVDPFGDKFEADQTYIDANTVQITFIAPMTGTAFLN